MVCKVLGNFDSDTFGEFLQKLQKYSFKFIYNNGALYIAPSDIRFTLLMESRIRKIFKPTKNYCIIPIDENNLRNEPQDIIDWCRDNFVELELQKYEIEQQEKLKLTLNRIDEFERILQANENNKIREEEVDGRS